MSMSINFVKIKPKGINIEYHGSDTSGVCTMVWYGIILIFCTFYPFRDLFSTSKNKVSNKQKSLDNTCSEVENTKKTRRLQGSSK